MPWFTRKWILIIRYLHFDAVALGGLSAEDKGRSCGKGRLVSLWGRESNHYWSMSWPVVVRTPTSSGNYSWPVLLRFVTSTGSFYVRCCYLSPMTAGCSINSCKSALYVLLDSPHSTCFEPIKKQSAQPHLSGWAGRSLSEYVGGCDLTSCGRRSMYRIHPHQSLFQWISCWMHPLLG